jgi:hypothetical protein
MVFDMHGEALFRRVEAGALWNRPAFQRAVDFKPKIIVQAARIMPKLRFA